MIEKLKACPICGKAIVKHREIKIGDKVFKFAILTCKCRERINIVEAKRKIKVEKLLEKSKIDNEFLSKTFPVSHKKIQLYYNSLTWIERGQQMFWYGGFGTFKTGHACEIIKKAIRKHLWFCLYYRASAIPVKWMDEKKMMKCKLLVIDNFAKGKEENWRGAVFDLIDYRIYNGLSNILISNNPSMSGIESIYGEAMISRLAGFFQIKMDGKDKRQEKDFYFGGK